MAAAIRVLFWCHDDHGKIRAQTLAHRVWASCPGRVGRVLAAVVAGTQGARHSYNYFRGRYFEEIEEACSVAIVRSSSPAM